MKAAIWTQQFFDKNDKPLRGGVQTYILELARGLKGTGAAPVIVDSHVRELHSEEEFGVPVEGVLPAEWKAAVAPLALHSKFYI